MNSYNLFQIYQRIKKGETGVCEEGHPAMFRGKDFTSCQSGPKEFKGKRHSKEGISPLVEFMLKMHSSEIDPGEHF